MNSAAIKISRVFIYLYIFMSLCTYFSNKITYRSSYLLLLAAFLASFGRRQDSSRSVYILKCTRWPHILLNCIPPVFQTIVSWATSALGIVCLRRQVYDRVVSAMAAHCLLRMGLRGREFKPRPGRRWISLSLSLYK